MYFPAVKSSCTVFSIDALFSSEPLYVRAALQAVFNSIIKGFRASREDIF